MWLAKASFRFVSAYFLCSYYMTLDGTLPLRQTHERFDIHYACLPTSYQYSRIRSYLIIASSNLTSQAHRPRPAATVHLVSILSPHFSFA
jgi:hypothetical protein